MSKMMKKTNSLLIAGALCFTLAFAFSSMADSAMICNHRLSNLPGWVQNEGDFDFNPDPVDITPTEKRADVTHFRAEGSEGVYTLDDTKESYSILTSQSSNGIPFYPADAVVYLNVKFTDNSGVEWTTDETAEFVLTHDANEFPPAVAWETILHGQVTFFNGADQFTLEEADAVVTP